jgi:hypothetical protein
MVSRTTYPAVSQPTTAYLSFDKRNLYVGWICKDEPAKVCAPHRQAERH